MTHVACRLTAKNRDQLRNPTLCNRVRATFTFTFTAQQNCSSNDDLHTHARIGYTDISTGKQPAKLAPSSGGVQTPNQHVVAWDHPSSQLTRHLDRFSRFRRAHRCVQQTHRQTDHATLCTRCGLTTTRRFNQDLRSVPVPAARTQRYRSQ